MKRGISSLVIALALAIPQPALAKKKPSSPEPARESAAVVVSIYPGSFVKAAVAESGFDVSGKYILPKFTESDAGILGDLETVCDLPFNDKAGGAESALIGIFGALLKPLFGVLFQKADKSIEKKLEAYKAEWSAGLTSSLFTTDANGVLQPKYRCLRIARVSEQSEVSSDKDVAVVNFDALLLIHWVPENQAWQLVPLRIHTGNPEARGDKVAFAMSMSGTSTTIIDGRGERQAFPETVVLQGKYKVASDANPTQGIGTTSYPIAVCELVQRGLRIPSAKLDNIAKKCSVGEVHNRNALLPNLPALPIPGSVPAGTKIDGSAVNLVFKVAEAGDGARKERLESWKAYLGKAADGLSDAMTTAISSLISDGK